MKIEKKKNRVIYLVEEKNEVQGKGKEQCQETNVVEVTRQAVLLMEIEINSRL